MNEPLTLEDLLQTETKLRHWLGFACDLAEMVRNDDSMLLKHYYRCLDTLEKANTISCEEHEFSSVQNTLSDATEIMRTVVTNFVNQQLLGQNTSECTQLTDIPAFNAIGYLPPGLHPTTWEQLANRYGTNDRRLSQLQGTLAALNLLKQGGVTEVRIGGSFVTAKKHPVDVDIYWSDQGVDYSRLDPIFQEDALGDPFNPHYAGLKRLLFGLDLHQLKNPDSLLSNYVRFSSRRWKTPNLHGDWCYCCDLSPHNADPQLVKLSTALPERRQVGAVVMSLTDDLPTADDFVPGSTWYPPNQIVRELCHYPQHIIALSPYLNSLVQKQQSNS